MYHGLNLHFPKEENGAATSSNNGIIVEDEAEIKSSTSQKTFDYLFKIVIIGDAVSCVLVMRKYYFAKLKYFQTCGKTSLMKRFIDDSFCCETLTTIGVDFNIKTFLVEGENVKLQIWY